MGCFSFYPGKNLGAYGEGGLVVTKDLEYARKIRMLRDWGAERKYEHVLKGYNYRLEGLQGAVLRVKFRYLEQWTGKVGPRPGWAWRYRRLLASRRERMTKLGIPYLFSISPVKEPIYPEMLPDGYPAADPRPDSTTADLPHYRRRRCRP